MIDPTINPATAAAPASALEASFDIVARQDQAEAAIGILRTDVDEVRTRLDRMARAAARPALGQPASPAALEAQGEADAFVNAYLRQGMTAEVKSTMSKPAPPLLHYCKHCGKSPCSLPSRRNLAHEQPFGGHEDGSGPDTARSELG